MKNSICNNEKQKILTYKLKKNAQNLYKKGFKIYLKSTKVHFTLFFFPSGNLFYLVLSEVENHVYILHTHKHSHIHISFYLTNQKEALWLCSKALRLIRKRSHFFFLLCTFFKTMQITISLTSIYIERVWITPLYIFTVTVNYIINVINIRVGHLRKC